MQIHTHPCSPCVWVCSMEVWSGSVFINSLILSLFIQIHGPCFVRICWQEVKSRLPPAFSHSPLCSTVTCSLTKNNVPPQNMEETTREQNKAGQCFLNLTQAGGGSAACRLIICWSYEMLSHWKDMRSVSCDFSHRGSSCRLLCSRQVQGPSPSQSTDFTVNCEGLYSVTLGPIITEITHFKSYLHVYRLTS